MTSLGLLLSIVWVHLLAVVSPGPDFIVAVKNSLRYGRGAGLYTAVWFGLWIAVHVTYCALWLALIISKSIILFTAIKWLGALYLIWLWVSSLVTKSSPLEILEPTCDKTSITRKAAVMQWFWTNVLNPKATIFFLWLFSMMITPTTPIRVIVLSCVLMVINTIVWFGVVTVLCTNSKARPLIQKYQKGISKVLWAALVALWVKVIATE